MPQLHRFFACAILTQLTLVLFLVHPWLPSESSVRPLAASVAHATAGADRAESSAVPSITAATVSSDTLAGGGSPHTTSTRSRACVADALLNSAARRQRIARVPSERYLLYAPQFGLSNQLVALRNAVAWAQLLNRTLVLPHLLAHGAVQPRAALGAAFDVAGARQRVRSLRVIEISAFLSTRAAPAGVLSLNTTNRFRAADEGAYFDSLGVTWHRGTDGQPVSHAAALPPGGYTPTSIVQSFGGCEGHQVLAFHSLFAAFDPKPLGPSPPGWHVCDGADGALAASASRAGGKGGGQGRPRQEAAAASAQCTPGLVWLDQIAMPALLTPSMALESIAQRIAESLRSGHADGAEVRSPSELLVGEVRSPSKLLVGGAADPRLRAEAAGSVRTLTCVHVRQGDFKEECRAYDDELRTPSVRWWVRWKFRNGFGCLQSEAELELNLRAAQEALAASGRPPLAVYASVEDAAALGRMPSLRRYNVSSLATFEPLVHAAELPLPPSLAAILLDQLTCAHAQVFILNAFSTFSQMVVGRVGLRHPRTLGWLRDLTRRQETSLGIHVSYWRRLADTSNRGSPRLAGRDTIRQALLSHDNGTRPFNSKGVAVSDAHRELRH